MRATVDMIEEKFHKEFEGLQELVGVTFDDETGEPLFAKIDIQQSDFNALQTALNAKIRVLKKLQKDYDKTLNYVNPLKGKKRVKA